MTHNNILSIGMRPFQLKQRDLDVMHDLLELSAAGEAIRWPQGWSEDAARAATEASRLGTEPSPKKLKAEKVAALGPEKRCVTGVPAAPTATTAGAFDPSTPIRHRHAIQLPVG